MKNAVDKAFRQENLKHLDYEVIHYLNRFSSIFPVMWMGQQAIADALGIRRETVNRILSKLTRLGIISKLYRGMYRTCIYILFPEPDLFQSVFDHTIKIREEPSRGRIGINKRRRRKRRSLSDKLFNNFSTLIHIGRTYVPDNIPLSLNL